LEKQGPEFEHLVRKWRAVHAAAAQERAAALADRTQRKAAMFRRKTMAKKWATLDCKPISEVLAQMAAAEEARSWLERARSEAEEQEEEQDAWELKIETSPPVASTPSQRATSFQRVLQGQRRLRSAAGVADRAKIALSTLPEGFPPVRDATVAAKLARAAQARAMADRRVVSASLTTPATRKVALTIATPATELILYMKNAPPTTHSNLVGSAASDPAVPAMQYSGATVDGLNV